MTYSALRSDLLAGHRTCQEITEYFLTSIEKQKRLNAFLSVFPERAILKAKEVDQKLKNGTHGKLAGMIIAVKDNLAMRNTQTTCGSAFLKPYVSPYDATVIRRLETEDAIFIGKTNMDEFGMGSSTENSAFGPVLNPHDDKRIPGGSSGGSAVAVAAGLTMAALGTDTGGSVRQPASHCGTVGLRPTYGRVSRYGLVAFASSLDTIGCLTQSVEDCARLFEVISGQDPLDSTSADVQVPDLLSFLQNDIKGLRIGLPKEYYGKGLADEVRGAVQKAVGFLQKEGATVHTVSLPHTEFGIATYYLICTAEASSNLARYDGVRFGLRLDNGNGINPMFEKTRTLGFGTEVKRRMMLGTYVLSAGYYDAYYRKAQKVRTLIRNDFKQAFEACDVIIGPTAPSTAFSLGECMDDPLTMYLSDIYTVTAPLAGLPSISVPIGKDTKALPIGIQLTGNAFREDELFWVADRLEKYYVN